MAVRWSKTVEKFILDKMSEGHTISAIKQKWPDKIPDPKTVYRRSQKDREWAEQLDQAYTLWYYAKLEEIDRLSSALASEIYPLVDFREAEAALKRRIDALKFALGKMAPIMSKRFDKAQKLDVKSENVGGPQYQVVNYYRAEKAIDQVVEPQTPQISVEEYADRIGKDDE